MEKTKELSLEKFILELSSNSPAPGGGSVAAICGSLASALGSMVFSLTVGKKAYEALDDAAKEKIKYAHEKSLILKDEFIDMIDEDVAVFNEVIAALKMPRGTEEEKAIRDKKIQDSLLNAMAVPMKVAETALSIYDILEVSAEYGNKNAISDAGVGAIMAQAAIEGAILNVKINLSNIKDQNVVKESEEKCIRILNEGNDKKAKIMGVVNNKI